MLSFLGYVHQADPYEKFDSLIDFALQQQLLTNEDTAKHTITSNAARTVLNSQQIPAAAHLVDVNAAASSISDSSAGTSSTVWYYLLSLLLVALILHAIIWIAQKIYVRNLNQLALNGVNRGNGKGTMHAASAAGVHYFSFLAPSNTVVASSSRVAALCGFVLGIASLLLLQFLFSQSVMQQTLGVSGSTPMHDTIGLRRDVTPTAAITLPEVHTCPAPPVCPVAAPCEKTNPFTSQSECHSLLNLPENQPPLHQQASYSPLKLYSIDCMDGDWMNSGKWSLRSEASPPAPPEWIKVDRWGMFGAQGRQNVDNKYIWNPPKECTAANGKKGNKGWFRRFNAEKFLKAIEGKTISFLGDSMNRQMFGMLTVMLDKHIKGNALYYTSHARYLDAVREYYLDYNVTLKNQWITGHQFSGSMLVDTFPTIWRSDLIVFNVGAFFHEGAEQKITETLDTFLQYTNKNYPGSLLWREYSPTHFPTPGGEFDMARNQAGVNHACQGFNPNDPNNKPEEVVARYGNYRVHTPNELMKKSGVPIMPIFNVSVVVPEAAAAHPGNGDCRHWFNPSHVLEHWCDVLYNMIVPPEIELLEA